MFECAVLGAFYEKFSDYNDAQYFARKWERERIIEIIEDSKVETHTNGMLVSVEKEVYNTALNDILEKISKEE